MKLKKCMPRFLSFYEGDTLYFILGNSSLRKQLNGNTLVYACKYLLGLSHTNQYDKHVNMSLSNKCKKRIRECQIPL